MTSDPDFKDTTLFDVEYLRNNRLSDCITVVRDWMANNRLKLNEDKTQVIWLGTRQQLSTRSSADADNRLDAFSGQSRTTNMVPFHMLHIRSRSYNAER